MLVLGHAGITLGSAIILNSFLHRKRYREESPSKRSATNGFLDKSLKSLAQRIDIRVLLIGSVLPDIIDKPLGRIIFQDTISNGRIFSHTALFLLLITITGTYLYTRLNRNMLLVLSFGIFTHLIFDQMWLAPHTLFWPLYGWNFPQGNPDIILFIKSMLVELISSPGVYLPEIIGATVLLIFTWQLIKLKSVNNFIGKGCI